MAFFKLIERIIASILIKYSPLFSSRIGNIGGKQRKIALAGAILVNQQSPSFFFLVIFVVFEKLRAFNLISVQLPIIIEQLPQIEKPFPFTQNGVAFLDRDLTVC